MRIEVDRERCEGLGMCEAMAHDYFEITETPDGEEVMSVLDDAPPESDRAQVFAAVQACPVLALTLQG